MINRGQGYASAKATKHKIDIKEKNAQPANFIKCTGTDKFVFKRQVRGVRRYAFSEENRDTSVSPNRSVNTSEGEYTPI